MTTSAGNPWTLEFPYKRSVGPIVGAFLTGLRDRKLHGIRDTRGRVLCPPMEWDPETGDGLSDLVELGEEGTVTTWAWVEEPIAKHPLDRPFAWGLITIDGADTPMLHAIDGGSREAMSTGMRVRVRWADERVGNITDIACFEPASA